MYPFSEAAMLLLKRALFAIGVAIVFSVTASASIIKDPDMGIDEGSLSDPIFTTTSFIPINGGGAFGFFNPGRTFITQIAFQVLIRPGLDQDTVLDAFHCQESNPFFLGCFVNYVPATGILRITLTGTVPEDDDDHPGHKHHKDADDHEPGE